MKTIRGGLSAWAKTAIIGGFLGYCLSASPAAAAVPARPARDGGLDVKEWTVLVYVNAKNDLEAFGLDDINEMESVGSSPEVNVVAELGRMSTYDSGYGGWHGVRRYLVARDTDTYIINSPVLETFMADMGDWRHLAEFGSWAKKNFPARKYMLIVWDHGTGWKRAAGKGPVFKGISYDEYSGNHMTTPELAAALREIGKVDVLAFDACLMQMAEVVYEVGDLADYVVGSEETEPGPGYPYDLFLKALAVNPGMSPGSLAVTLVDVFGAYYGSGTIATQSAVKTSELPRLVEMISGWVEAVMAAGAKGPAVAAMRAAQSFNTVDNKDMADFLRLAGEGAGNPEIHAKSKELTELITGELVLRHRAAGDSYGASRGLAVYLPGHRYDPGYETLRWAADSRWDEFINWYLH